MKADFRVCPNCGARNKAKWEYCVRCSEALQGVPLGEPADAAPPDTDAVAVQDYGEGAPWGSIFGSLILVAIGVGVFQLTRQPPAAPPPELFTVGTVPPSLPPAQPASAGNPGAAEYLEGLQRLNANDPARAAQLFQSAAALAPDNHAYRHAYAVALWASGAKRESIDEYESALRLAPENLTYRINLAKALASVGRKDEAIAEYEILIQRHGHVQAVEEAARLLADSDPARARDLLRVAATARPGDPVIKQQLASLLEKTGDPEGAAEVYSKILADQPSAHITRGLLAEMHIKRGQPDEAVALFRSGLAQYPDVPLLHRGLASALERSGSVGEAIAEYREYVRLAPNAPDAQQLRDRADRLEKRVASAS